MNTEIAPRATIGQLVGIRDRALKRYAALVREGSEINELTKPLNEKSYMLPTVSICCEYGRGAGTTPVESYRRRLDAAAWDHLLTKTEMRDLMSANQKSDWRKQLDQDPPEFTLETAVATFEDMRGRSDEIFRQGLVDVFEALPRDFRSHDGFKIGARCVLTYAVSYWFGRASWMHSSHNNRRDQIGDLDRTFHALTGNEWNSNFADHAAKAMEVGESEFESRFFRMRWFKNGNIHIWFIDKDATKKANKLLAEHYGARLGRMHLHPDRR